MKAHDRLPPIQATLGTASGATDLSTATSVKFIMKTEQGNTLKVNSAAVVVNAATGLVRYDWLAVDTDTPGKYQGEWEVTWATGKKQTFPTTSYHSIEILQDLDNA